MSTIFSYLLGTYYPITLMIPINKFKAAWKCITWKYLKINVVYADLAKLHNAFWRVYYFLFRVHKTTNLDKLAPQTIKDTVLILKKDYSLPNSLPVEFSILNLSAYKEGVFFYIFLLYMCNILNTEKN